MAFEVVFLPDAEKQLRALDGVTVKRLLRKLAWIAKQIDPMRHAVMLHNPKIGDLRFRIGDYRAVAVVEHGKKKISIVAIGHRRDIYR
ncbi:MAG TPA: type II toxin-antitoxin system RelE/ParE family toxin [Candidatus Methylomirabilis sp.]|nr:type II toxin-antitoxin system RelE/ParE family toxin [Candidatus Methylomirabilis sp.]